MCGEEVRCWQYIILLLLPELYFMYTVYVYEKKEYKKDTLFFNIKIIPINGKL